MARGGVRLTGRLICLDDGQAALVHRHLPRHSMLTRAESGCLAFDVVSTDDPLVWRVDEEFSSDEAFDAHRRRVADSEWGRATAGIERDYTVLPAGRA